MTTETIPIDLTKSYTVAEFMALPDIEGYNLELWEGMIRMTPPPSDGHGRVANWICTYLTNYTMLNNQLGQVWDNGGFVILRDPTTQKETVLAPDAAYIAHPNVPANTYTGPVPRPPDLAVEVQSPSETVNDVIDKVRKYQQGGVKLIWVIQPSQRIAAIFHQGDDWPATIQPDGWLDGEDVIPGFKLELKTLFI